MMSLAQNGETWFETVVGLYWNGDYDQTLQELDSVALADLSDGEKLEVHKYRAFSYIALGDNERAQREFSELLSIDPTHQFDASCVSPKSIGQFDEGRGRRSVEIGGFVAFPVKEFGLDHQGFLVGEVFTNIGCVKISRVPITPMTSW